MAFDWSAYLSLARELAEREDEAALRSAVSRAYYAVLGTARARLMREGVPLPLDAGSHRAVWEEYETSPEDARHFIGQDGNYLRGLRNEADYEADAADLAGKARLAVLYAQALLQALRRLP